MTGGYLEIQINGYIVGPIRAFREYIFSDVISAFGNLEERAGVVANEYYDKIGSQPAWNDADIDMAGVAEAAHDKSLSWYQMMTSLRQSMLNLLAAGLFHLTEHSSPSCAVTEAHDAATRGHPARRGQEMVRSSPSSRSGDATPMGAD